MPQICVATIQACKQNAILIPRHSWWPLKAVREPFHGYKLSMVLNNHLELGKDSLVKALNGKAKSIAMRLVNTVHGSFIFRKLGDSTCVAIANKKAGQLVWVNEPDAVPTMDNTVEKEQCIIENIFISFAA
jgi:hypothetical protein